MKQIHSFSIQCLPKKAGNILVYFSLILCFLSTSINAQTTIWTYGTARNVPERQAEFGIVHPLQIGLTETLEVSTSPLLLLSLAPNISFKNRWWTGQNLMIATQHTYAMPTMGVRFLGEDVLFKNDSIFDLIPDTIPYLFFIRNKGLFTWKIGMETLLTANLGASFALQTKGDSLPYFERPMFYPHSSALNKKFSWDIGTQIDGNIYKNHNYSASIDFHSIGIALDDWALVHKGYYIYNHSIKFAVLAGYRMIYASYPGTITGQPYNKFSIMPVVDLIWKINAKPEPTKDLFRR